MAGNNSNVEVVLNVIPDPLTTVIGQVVQLDETPIANVEVTCQNVSTIAGDDGGFTISGLAISFT